MRRRDNEENKGEVATTGNSTLGNRIYNGFKKAGNVLLLASVIGAITGGLLLLIPGIQAIAWTFLIVSLVVGFSALKLVIGLFIGGAIYNATTSKD